MPAMSCSARTKWASSAFIIISGEADVTVDTPAGPLVVAHVGRNDFIGEIAILCDVPRTASVVARTDMTALCISKDLFFRLVTEFPQMAVEIMRVLAQRLENTTRQLREAVSSGKPADPAVIDIAIFEEGVS